MDLNRGVEIPLHVFRYHYDGVSVKSNHLAELLQDLTATCGLSVLVSELAKQITAPEGHYEWNALRQGQQCALPELSVYKVVAPTLESALYLPPGSQVIEWVLPPLKVKDVNIDPGRHQKIGLTLDERGRLRMASSRPLACNHQDANRRRHFKNRSPTINQPEPSRRLQDGVAHLKRLVPSSRSQTTL